jgi:hypothetical protein
VEEGGRPEERERVPAGKEKEREVPAIRPRERRLRFGPGSSLSSARAMSVTGPHPDVPLDREVGIISRALEDHGSANRRELARRVGARYWGPGRFRAALREAVAKGAVRRLPRGEYAPVTSNDSTLPGGGASSRDLHSTG